MKYIPDKSEKKTLYIQLYEQLKRDIMHGIYPYGSKLPSKRTLADEAGISVIPVEHAYTLLCEEGYAEARERSGYFVIYRETDFLCTETVPHKAGLPSNPPPTPVDVFPFSVMAKTMRKVMLDYGERILTRSPNRGCPELREAITAYLARSIGMTVTPQQIVIGSGAEYLYSLLAQLFGRAEAFAIEHPAYEKIGRVYTANGVAYEALQLGEDGILSSELEKTGARILHVTPFHSFPSGISASASKRQEYLRWAEKRKGYIIEDNYDSELTVSKKLDDTLFAAKTGRVIYLNTFSHTVAPSLRIGYMILPQELLEEFEQKLGFYACTVPLFEQLVLAELIQNGDFERHINRVRRKRRAAQG